MLESQSEINGLRRDIRRLHIMIVVMGCAVVSLAVAFIGLRPLSVHASTVPDVITAKKFVVVDDLNNPVVEIGQFALPAGYSPGDLPAGTKMTGIAIFAAAGTVSPSQPLNQLVTLGIFPYRLGEISSLQIATGDESSAAVLQASPNHKVPWVGGGQALFQLKQKGFDNAIYQGQEVNLFLIANAPGGTIGTHTLYHKHGAPPNSFIESANLISSPGRTGQMNCKNDSVCSPIHY